MALSTTQYGYIIDPMVPFTDDKGKTIKNGFVRVFVAGSSTPVVTYRNFDGATNQDRIELDNSGRTKTSVIGSKGITYKVCVYDQRHSQESPILTVDKVSVIGANITAGAGATVVTGLDGLTTKPDGFVDASVIGTDGYVALDHTLVTDDLDTDAKVKAVENDRYIPLLNEDVNDSDSKITLKRLKQWVHNDNVVIAGTIYPTLQDAIADADDLSVGDIFETNGFHTNGDGGAARYLVSDTGTANGMDIVQLADGKLATIQVTQECSPEQIGYATGTDAVPYIVRLIAIGIKKIRLIKNYTWKTTLTLTTRGIDFVGNIPFTQSPVTSLINVNLNQGLTSAIVLRAPNITFENLYFYNAKGSPSDEIAVDCDWTSNANNYMIKFKRVRFVSFNYGVYFHGTLPWHITFEDVVLGWCNYGIVFAANSSIISFKNVHTSGCYVCGINMRGATQGVTFTQCNFGSYSNALHFEKYGLGMNQEYTFSGCNFELDKLDLDGNTKNVFIDVDNDINVSLDFKGCNFVITKSEMQVIPANMRFIRLGNGSTLRMTACIIEDDLSGNAYLKQFIDESRTPLQETGSLSIDSTTRFFEVADALIPYVMRTGQAKGLVADGARTGSEVAISDCNNWIPDYDGEVKVARVSTYEGTQNMPVSTSFYGFLWTMGVIHGPNIRVWQMLLGSNGNIYTRLGMDLGSGMTWNVWKTITAT